MSRRRPVIDASSAILLHKADLFDTTADAYDLGVPATVFRELTDHDRAGARAFRAAAEARRLRILPDPGLPGAAGLHDGEREVIGCLVSGAGEFVIIDDRPGAAWCRDRSLPYINALLIARIMALCGRMPDTEATAASRRIMDIGRYSAAIAKQARTIPAHALEEFFPTP